MFLYIKKVFKDMEFAHKDDMEQVINTDQVVRVTFDDDSYTTIKFTNGESSIYDDPGKRLFTVFKDMALEDMDSMMPGANVSTEEDKSVKEV